MLCTRPVLLVGTLNSLVIIFRLRIGYPVCILGYLEHREGGFGLIVNIEALGYRIKTERSLLRAGFDVEIHAVLADKALICQRLSCPGNIPPVAF